MKVLEIELVDGVDMGRCCSKTFYKIRSRKPLFLSRELQKTVSYIQWYTDEQIKENNEENMRLLKRFICGGQEQGVDINGAQLSDGRWEYDGYDVCDSSG